MILPTKKFYPPEIYNHPYFGMKTAIPPLHTTIDHYINHTEGFGPAIIYLQVQLQLSYSIIVNFIRFFEQTFATFFLYIRNTCLSAAVWLRANLDKIYIAQDIAALMFPTINLLTL